MCASWPCLEKAFTLMHAVNLRGVLTLCSSSSFRVGIDEKLQARGKKNVPLVDISIFAIKICAPLVHIFFLSACTF